MFYTVTLNPALDIFIDAPDFVPGAVNIATGFRRVSGGKGINVARMLNSLGAPCIACGIACGAAGDSLLFGLDDEGMSHDFVRSGGETRTNIKITDTNSGITTDVNQVGAALSQSALDELFARLTERVQKGDTVALCGSLPKGVDDGIYAKWIKQLKSLGANAALDTSKNPLLLGISACPSIIKPNIAELGATMGKQINTAKQALKECRRITDSGVGLVALSLGESGALFVRSGESAFVPGLRVEVRSTTGAGDSLLAGLLFALSKEYDLKSAAAFAVAISAARISTAPGETLEADTIQRLFEEAKLKMAGVELENAFYE